MKNLREVDVGRGKLFERMERLYGEIVQATHLLRELDAEGCLLTDMTLVACLVGKLPPDTKKDWIEYSSKLNVDVTPGETEWPSSWSG